MCSLGKKLYSDLQKFRLGKCAQTSNVLRAQKGVLKPEKFKLTKFDVNSLKIPFPEYSTHPPPPPPLWSSTFHIPLAAKTNRSVTTQTNQHTSSLPLQQEGKPSFCSLTPPQPGVVCTGQLSGPVHRASLLNHFTQLRT